MKVEEAAMAMGDGKGIRRAQRQLNTTQRSRRNTGLLLFVIYLYFCYPGNAHSGVLILAFSLSGMSN